MNKASRLRQYYSLYTSFCVNNHLAFSDWDEILWKFSLIARNIFDRNRFIDLIIHEFNPNILWEIQRTNNSQSDGCKRLFRHDKKLKYD